LLRGPFARYSVGNFTSNLGTWFQDIASVILIFQLTGSAAMVALVVVCGYGASLLLSPLGGALADRFDRRNLLIVTQLAMGTAALILAAFAFSDTVDAVVVFVISAVIGAGRAISNPTIQALIPALVARKDLAGATALQSMTFNVARAVGPVVGALLIASAGPAPAFALNAASFYLFVLILLTLRPVRRTAAGVRGGMRVVLAYVRDRPTLVVALLCCTLVGMATDPVITLGPSLAERFGHDESFAGWIVSSFGAGSLIGAPLAGRIRRRLRPRRTAIAATMLIALCFVTVSLSPWLPLALGAFVVAGAAFLVASSDLVTGVHEEVDDRVRGRVMALWTMGFLGSRPLAAALDGAVGDAAGPQAAIALLAGVLALGAGACGVAFRRLPRFPPKPLR
jgi:MFS family permease